MKTQLIISNVKCEGCARSIQNGLKQFSLVSEVTVDVKKQLVTIIHEENFQIAKAKEKLAALGYPEKDSLEGFDKLAANARAYISCVIG